MATVRRWYVFLVCAVSLQSATWAVIALLRNLLTPGREAPVTTIAFQIAVIVIGLPLFLAHWLWAQHLAAREADERASALRRLYLYATLAGFLCPFLANAFDLTAWVLWLIFGGKSGARSYDEYSATQAIIRAVSALVVLALLWFYHQRVTAADARTVPETGNAATVRRLYLLSFSAVGLTMTTLGIIHLLRWIMFQFGGETTAPSSGLSGLTDEVARLVVGMPLWLMFWRWATQLFTRPSEEERESALRKFYLYVAVFIAALSAVANATFILAGFLRRVLALKPQGDIRQPLPIILGMVILWAYHAYVLRSDAALTAEAPRQAGIRRLYLYLVATVGLAALLVGLSGDISVLIRSLAELSSSNDLREQLAWFTAALIAGLPVWLLPWRSAQLGAVASPPVGMEERRSVVRKIYLYFYLFVATLTVLSSLVYIVYRLLSLVLGEAGTGNLLSDLGHAIAFSVIAVGVWLYHGSALRGDGQRSRREQTARLQSLRVAVVDGGAGHFGRAVLDGLRREVPGLTLDSIGLTPAGAAAMGIAHNHEAVPAQLAAAGLIVGLFDITIAGGEIASLVAASPARKLLVPVRLEGWEWVGVDRWNGEALVRQTVHAVKQIAAEEEVKPVRPLSAGAIIGLVVGGLLLLVLVVIPLIYYFAIGGF